MMIGFKIEEPYTWTIEVSLTTRFNGRIRPWGFACFGRWRHEPFDGAKWKGVKIDFCSAGKMAGRWFRITRAWSADMQAY